MNKPKKLLNCATSMLKEAHPELRGKMEGLSPIYAKVIFANRMEKSLLQQDLATKENVGLKTNSRAEGGFDNLSTETYDKIFLALNLEIRDLAEAMIQLQSDKDELASTSI